MRFFFALVVLTFLFSCSKDESQVILPPVQTHPEMLYTDLQNREVTYYDGQLLDIDQNGTNDFLFKTMHIGDPIDMVDKIRFSVSSSIYSSLFVSEQNISPALAKGDNISKQNQLPYEWFIISEVEMAEKIIRAEVPPVWQGNWKDAAHRYLAVQVTRGDKLYHGWVELSFDTNNTKLILHKAAISKEADKAIKAGF